MEKKKSIGVVSPTRLRLAELESGNAVQNCSGSYHYLHSEDVELKTDCCREERSYVNVAVVACSNTGNK